MTLEVTHKKSTKTTKTTDTTKSRHTTESNTEFKFKLNLTDALVKLASKFGGWIVSLFSSADTS